MLCLSPVASPTTITCVCTLSSVGRRHLPDHDDIRGIVATTTMTMMAAEEEEEEKAKDKEH